MSLKTILVCLTSKDTAEELMAAAVPLARTHRAHLIGLHTLEALMVYPGIAMHVPDPVFAHFNESQQAETDAIEATFRKHTDHETFVSEWRFLRTESVRAADRMVESARAADLVIMPRENREWDRGDQAQAQDRVIRESGRPVLVIPKGYSGPTIGKSAVLGWADTREAARAAHDLIRVAQPDAAVDILSVGTMAEELLDAPANAMAESMTRHGLKATVTHRPKDGLNVADVLNQHAFEVGADMIVTGAFGHSRTYDFVIGAATNALLHDAKFPVMFSK